MHLSQTGKQASKQARKQANNNQPTKQHVYTCVELGMAKHRQQCFVECQQGSHMLGTEPYSHCNKHACFACFDVIPVVY